MAFEDSHLDSYFAINTEGQPIFIATYASIPFYDICHTPCNISEICASALVLLSEPTVQWNLKS